MEKHKWQEVECKDCLIKWKKRVDTLNIWQGRCRSCAQKFESSKPERIDMSRKLGILVTTKYGGIKNARKFTSEMVRGDKNHFWKGGITPLNRKLRQSKEYLEWRKKVFERDNYTCVFCGKRGVLLHADHIKQFAFFPELRTELSNGRTLCVECHKGTTTYKRKILVVT